MTDAKTDDKKDLFLTKEDKIDLIEKMSKDKIDLIKWMLVFGSLLFCCYWLTGF